MAPPLGKLVCPITPPPNRDNSQLVLEIKLTSPFRVISCQVISNKSQKISMSPFKIKDDVTSPISEEEIEILSAITSESLPVSVPPNSTVTFNAVKDESIKFNIPPS